MANRKSSAKPPELRTQTVKYWWCGGKRCRTQHQSLKAASTCFRRWDKAKKKQNLEPRNSHIWLRVMVDRASYKEAGKDHDLSPERVRQIVMRYARRHYGVRFVDQPNDLRMVDWIRGQISGQQYRE